MKWEYKIVIVGGAVTDDEWQVKLNSFGAEGWELVSVVHFRTTTQFFHYFKRPVEAKPARRKVEK